MYSKILVPVDSSEPSKLGLAEAIKLAHALHARLCLIHVVDVGAVMASQVDAISYDIVIESLRRTGAAVLKEAYEMVRDSGLEVDTTLPEDWQTPVGECIVQMARQCHAELIVCGTHGRRGVRRLLMGSDAEYIVRHSPVPVLLVRPPDAGTLDCKSKVAPALTAGLRSGTLG